jgi:hypothetical protein
VGRDGERLLMRSGQEVRVARGGEGRGMLAERSSRRKKEQSHGWKMWQFSGCVLRVLK